jgi:hypothetical protein
MTDNDERKDIAEIDEALALLARPSLTDPRRSELRREKEEWKATDPEGYKKDMEKMCKDMFGDTWQSEYESMLREEFPEDFA